MPFLVGISRAGPRPVTPAGALLEAAASPQSPMPPSGQASRFTDVASNGGDSCLQLSPQRSADTASAPSANSGLGEPLPLLSPGLPEVRDPSPSCSTLQTEYSYLHVC